MSEELSAIPRPGHPEVIPEVAKEPATGATPMANPGANPAALTVAQLARLLGVAEEKVREHVSAGAPAAARFLEEVAPLITPAERAAYLELERPYQRQAFESRFWQVRDPFPETPGNEFADRWHERAPVARERWGSLDDARSLAFASRDLSAFTPSMSCTSRSLLSSTSERMTIPFCSQGVTTVSCTWCTAGSAKTTSDRRV